MWRLVKYELKYYRVVFAAPIFFILLFSAMELFVFYASPELKNNLSDIDFGGEFYLLIILVSFGTIWSSRFKEKRMMYFSTLPVSQKEIALARLWTAVIPFMVLALYLLAFQLASGGLFQSMSDSLSLQIGLAFIIIASFIKARDKWLSSRRAWIRTLAVTVVILTAAIPVIFLIIGFQRFETHLGEIRYTLVGLCFYLLGLAITITTLYSYQKRNSYFS